MQTTSDVLTQPAITTPVPHALPRPLWRGHLLNYVLLSLGALVMVGPFLWMLGTSFKAPAETVAFPPTLWPAQPTLENYADVANRLEIGRLYWNTTVVSVIKTILMVYSGALLGYIFAKFEFPGKNLIFIGILSTMIIPFEVYMIPLYVMMVRAKLGDTYMALVLPSVFSAYAIFLFRQFMYTIPNDLIDAARADGAGEFHIFHRIVLPLSKPILVTMTSFYFMWEWNDFLWPLIVITDPNKYLLSVGLATLVGEHATDYGLIMAGASLAILPILAVFLVLQRHVIRGITMTGMK
ncbi:MAG: carbohydrate ABC transporter permease [Thermomicrobiales bacterium]